ncbi:MAG TPA: HipA N-terminal domain-containing protein [Spirochaetia bacterium]|nr:HipA N-terminal domain-containing protein [Spirochaetia bacterium]
MRKARVRVHDRPAAVLEEAEPKRRYRLRYDSAYQGEPVSLALPVRSEPYEFDGFPPFFDGLLPEGYQLDALLRSAKIDRDDLFSQLVVVGGDLVGSVTVEPLPDEGA